MVKRDTDARLTKLEAVRPQNAELDALLKALSDDDLRELDRVLDAAENGEIAEAAKLAYWRDLLARYT